MAISGSVVWKSGVQFEAFARNHKIVMDSPKSDTNSGPSPKELALLSMAGCSGMDIATILTKKRLELLGCEIKIETDVTEGQPSIFKNVKIIFEINGGKNLLKEHAISAVELSMTKYCGVTAMFTPICDISYEVFLNSQLIGNGKPLFELKGQMI